MIFNFKEKNSLKNFLEKDIKFDIQIVGAGISGISLAHFLLKNNPKLNVLLIERGDFINKTQAKNQINAVKFDGLRIKNDSRVFGVGGSSITWGNIISNITKEEISNKWPIKFYEIEKLCNKAAHILNLENSSGRNLKENERKFNYTSYPTNFTKFLDTSKVNLLYNCKIEQIFEKKNYNYSHIRYQKKNFVIKSKKMVLCLGTFEIIKLLFNSFRKEKFLNINKRVLGKYFMNHPKFNIGEIKFLNKKIDIRKYLLKKNGNKLSYIGVSLPKNIKKKYNLLNSYVRFKQKKYSYLENKINQKSSFFIKVKHVVHLKVLNLLDQFDFFLKKRTFLIKIFVEMEPNEKNKVTLNKKKMINVRSSLSKKDIKTITILRDFIFKKFSFNYEGEEKVELTKEFIYKYSQDASHHMGGTSYNHDKKKSFVDKNLKIIGTKNIFICSSSVFPTSGSVNPTLIILALGLRLSKFLLRN